MPTGPFDSDILKQVFAETQVVRTPLTGIIQGYHVLPYILVGPEERRARRSIEIRGKIRVSPRLVISPSVRGETYGDLFRDSEVMDQALVARVFSFFYSARQNVALESEELRISKLDREPSAQINAAGMLMWACVASIARCVPSSLSPDTRYRTRRRSDGDAISHMCGARWFTEICRPLPSNATRSRTFFANSCSA